MNNFPKSANLILRYNQALQDITDVSSEKVMVSEGILFLHFLHFVFTSYPEIQNRFPPGKLGLLVNGRPPTDFTRLKDGDIVSLYGME